MGFSARRPIRERETRTSTSAQIFALLGNPSRTGLWEIYRRAVRGGRGGGRKRKSKRKKTTTVFPSRGYIPPAYQSLEVERCSLTGSIIDQKPPCRDILSKFRDGMGSCSQSPVSVSVLLTHPRKRLQTTRNVESLYPSVVYVPLRQIHIQLWP